MGTHPIFESDFDCLTDSNRKWANPEEFDARVRCETGDATSDGPILATRRPTWAQLSKLIHSEGLPMRRGLFSRKSASKLNNRTPLFVNAQSSVDQKWQKITAF